MTISAEVIEDSIWMGRRITTLLLRYPRFIHAEFMTHRVFSRNASSSRAIPFKKQKADIFREPATFVSWGSNKPGMQAGAELQGWRRWLAQLSWSLGLWVLLPITWLMHLSGVHKQVINRMLEPWAHINVIVTATEWDNFFDLRCHSAAQPEMFRLAHQIEECLIYSTPVKRKQHLPFVTQEERTNTGDLYYEGRNTWYGRDYALQLFSAARCARLSYYTFGEMNISQEADFKLGFRLSKEKHMSPFEHAAIGIRTPVSVGRDNPMGWRANFFGWASTRWQMENPTK